MLKSLCAAKRPTIKAPLAARGLGTNRRLHTYFFFSSRRRHTRFDCDWSSDVCSSDLPSSAEIADDGHGFDPESVVARGRRNFGLQFMRERAELIGARFEVRSRPGERSEERRVGKECRSRWSPYH